MSAPENHFYEGNDKKKGKCFKMHVRHSNKNCPKLKVHEKEMIQVNEVKYLGEILSSDAKNTKNMKQRLAKGMG